MSVPSFADADLPVGVEDVELAVFEGEAVLFRESTRMVHRLNAVAASVWLLCDGETAVGAMAAELSQLFGHEPDALVDGIHQALGQLADEGLLAGFEAPLRAHLELAEDVADDGSRVLRPPPDT